jgi:hypothetical protein
MEMKAVGAAGEAAGVVLRLIDASDESGGPQCSKGVGDRVLRQAELVGECTH